MKRIFTLAAAGALAATTLGAQAQVTVNGTLAAAETNGAATTGDYVLLGQYPYAHNFGPWGLLSLYGANTPSKVQMFVGGTLQGSATNSLQVYLDLPATTGVPMGTALPGTTQTTATSLDKFTAKLDQGAEMALALHSLNPATGATTPAYQIEAAAYYVMTAASGTTPAVYAAQDTVISPITSTGTVVTIGRISAKSRFAGLSGARFSYVAPTGDITTNPGYTAPMTTAVTSYPVAGYGQAAGTTGWEIELDRTSLGLPTGNPSLGVFAIQNNGGGDYASGDFLPNAVASGANLGAGGASPDFTSAAFPGTQSATFALATVTLATKVAASTLGLSMYPNPATGTATVAYQVADRAAHVSIVLTDLVGRTVRTLENGLKPVGPQTAAVDASALAAGTYLMRVQVGDKVSTSKLSVR